MEPLENGAKEGTVVYCHNNYIYKCKSTGTQGTKYFICTYALCTIRARKYVDGRVVVSGEHAHPPQNEQMKVLKLKQHLKKSAGHRKNQNMRQVFEHVCERHQDVAEQLAFVNVRAAMYRSRNRHLPPIPHNLQQYAQTITSEEWGMWGRTKANEPQDFFQTIIDNVEEAWSAVIFFSRRLLPLVNETKELHIDATFQVVPRELHTYQLLTIHALCEGAESHFLPAFYVLMTRKSEESYRGVLEEIISNICPDSFGRVEKVMTDYELGLMNVASQAWPHARVFGCFFHYAQAVFRKAAELRMIPLVRNNQLARRYLKMLMALVLLPADEMHTGLQYVREQIQHDALQAEFARILTYVQRQWLGIVGSERCSVYPEPHRTNNALEGFYSHLLKRMGSRPSVWKFTEELRTIEHSVADDYTRLMNGLKARGYRHKITKDADGRILAAWTEYQTGRLGINGMLARFCHAVDNLEENLRGQHVDEPEEEDPQPDAEDP